MSKFAAALLPVEKPVRMLLKHPKTNAPYADIDGNFAYIDVYSSDSNHMRELVRKRAADRLEEKVRRTLTVAEVEAEQVENVAVLTAGWNLLSLDGVEIGDKLVHEPIPVEWSIENAKELFADPGGALYYDQVSEHTGTRANFCGASSKS